MTTRLTVFSVFVLIGALAPVALAAEIRVPQDQPTIQAAVDASSDGDEIVIRGKHTTNVVISGKTDLTLRGVGKATVDGSGDDYGIQVVSSTRVTITKLSVVNSGRAGIRVEESIDCVVSKCRLKDNGDIAGVSLVATIDALIEKCKISGGTGHGVETFSTTAEVLSCKVTGVGGNGVSIDFLSGACVVQGNRVKRVAGHGLNFESGSGHDVIGNTVHTPERAGMVFALGDLTVRDNKVIKPGACGIETAKGTTNSSFTNNKIVKPGDAGILVSGDACVYDGNKVKKAGTYGFQIFAGLATGNTIRNNKATKSALFDLDDQDAVSNQIYMDNVFPTIAPLIV